MSNSQPTRTEYTNELRGLQDDVLRMGSMVDRQINRAVEALRKQDINGAQQVIELDLKINDARWKIEDDTILMIARQGPMAGDLRRIMASVHIATNLERMGDHAEGIARLTLRTADQPHLHELDGIATMSETSRAMLNDALQAYVDNDPDAAREISRRDDDVDELYERVYHDMLTIMIADQNTVTRATHLLWVAHNLERIADRVTNVCERIIFAATGEFEEVNRKNFGDRFSDTN